MCNFYGHRVKYLEFIRLKDIEKNFGKEFALAELNDGFVYGNHPVIRKAGDYDFEVVQMHWEFIPWWNKTMDEVTANRKIPTLNATSEKLLHSKMFRDAALKRRCLVPAGHFFEWRHYKPDGATKDIAYPYLIEPMDADHFLFAGIWQPWTDRETGEAVDTFAIVTTKANDLMQVIHNKKSRMPTMLTEELAWEWIMGDLTEGRIQEIASYQIPSEELHAYTVAKDFKRSSTPLSPFQYDDLPDLDVSI